MNFLANSIFQAREGQKLIATFVFFFNQDKFLAGLITFPKEVSVK